MPQNIWTVGQDTLLEEMAAREIKRLQQEQLARDLEDRQREIARQADADSRARRAFETQDEAAQYAKSRRGFNEAAEETELALDTSNTLSAIGSRTAADERAGNADARAAGADARDAESHAMSMADSQETLNAKRMIREVQRRYMATNDPAERRALVETLAALEGRVLPQTAGTQGAQRLPPNVQTMVSRLAAAKGMDYETMMAGLRAAGPRIMEENPGVNLEDVMRFGSALLPRPASQSGLDSLLREDPGSEPIDAMGIMFGDEGGAGASAQGVPAEIAADPYLSEAWSRIQADSPGEEVDPEVLANLAELLRDRAESGSSGRRGGLTQRPSAAPMGPVAGRGSRTAEVSIPMGASSTVRRGNTRN